MPITPESLETSSSLVTPFVHLGMGESSVPSELRDIFDMDSVEDLAEDAAKRGGPERRGDMTRPLKNRKVRTESFKPRRYYIAPSFFMAMALEYFPNLKASPSTLKGDAKKSMEKFFRDYADKGARLKQDGGIDCGIYVSKYMGAMLNGISLPSTVWNAKVDVQTFRHRMAHELSKGVARHISEWGIRQREAGH
ncbi:hypothetical protein AgCh_015918 [Apium graveolens]